MLVTLRTFLSPEARRRSRIPAGRGEGGFTLIQRVKHRLNVVRPWWEACTATPRFPFELRRKEETRLRGKRESWSIKGLVVGTHA